MITVGQTLLLALGCWISGIVFVAAMTSMVPDLKQRAEFKITAKGFWKHLFFTLLGFVAGWAIGYIFSSIVGPALTESLPTEPAVVVDVNEIIHNYAIMFGLVFTFLVSLVGSMVLLTHRKEN